MQQPERAARLLGAAVGVLRDFGKPTLPLPWPPRYNQTVAGARRALGEARFALPHGQKGGPCPLDQAIHYALGEA